MSECLCLKSAIFANALFYCHSYCRAPARNTAFCMAVVATERVNSIE